MKNTWKRLGALLLAVAMTLTLLPTAAFAAGEDAADSKHFTPLKRTIIDGFGNGFDGWTANNTNYSIIEGEAIFGDTASPVNGPNFTLTRNGSAPGWSSTVLIQFDMVTPVAVGGTKSAEHFKVRLMKNTSEAPAANEKWLEVRFNFSESKAVIETANDSCDGATNYSLLSGEVTFSSDFWTPGEKYPVEIKLENKAITVYWDGKELLSQTVPDATYAKMAPCPLQFASQYQRQNHTLSNLLVTTDDVPDNPTITKYIRHTGDIEPGVYLIHSPTDSGINLHNFDTATTQCGDPDPAGDELGTGQSSSHDGTDHQWKIAGNATDGYTIQGVTAGKQKYLTATASSNQLVLSSDSTAAVKLTFTQEGNGYKVSYTDSGTTKYLRFTGTTGSRGWNFADTGDVLQLFKETAIPVATTIADASDNSQDVGVTNGVYSNTDQCAVNAWASSQHASGNDGPATWAIDGSESSYWHTRWDSDATPANEENTDQKTTARAGWRSDKIGESLENRWIELDIKENDGAAQWLSGLRYKGANSNGRVITCEIRVWDMENSAWVKVTSDTSWTLGDGTGWSYKEFDFPVHTNKVRLYGVTTQSNGGANAFMRANEIRLVKALNDNPTTGNATITVNSSKNNTPIAGAKVVIGGQCATTDESGHATVSLILDREYTGTVTAPSHLDGTVTITGAVNASGAVTLTAIDRTISGKVTTADGDEGVAVENATVQLVGNAPDYAYVAGVTTTTSSEEGQKGEYTLDVYNVPAGTYYVRVSKDDSGATLIGPVTLEKTGENEQATGKNGTLAPIETTDATKTYTFNAQTDADSFEAKGTANVGYDSEKKALKLTFGSDANVAGNIVLLKDFAMKNGVVEFDVTPVAGAIDSRFGVVWQYSGESNNTAKFLHIGQFDGKYGYQYYDKTQTKPDRDYNNSNDGPVLALNTTRHFKITVTDTAIAIEVDGIKVPDITGATFGSSGGFGFADRYADNFQYLIDNLYITRTDAQKEVAVTVTPDGVSGNSLTVAPTTTAEEKTLAYVGDTVTVTGACATGHGLQKVTVARTDAAGGNATDSIEATKGEDGTFTFVMPNYAVTVTGTFLPKVGVALDETAQNKFVVGGIITVKATNAATDAAITGDGQVNYQWYHNQGDDDNPDWILCNGHTNATKTPGPEDKDHKVKVVVTGDGVNYYNGETAEWVSTQEVMDVIAVTGVTILQSNQTIILNSENKTVQLTAQVNPGDATEQGVTWSSRDENVATVDNKGLVTAVGEGTATITATAVGNEEKSDSVTITVQVKPESIKVTDSANTETEYDGENGITLYANEGNTIPAGGSNTITLTATLGAEDEDLTVSDALNGVTWALAESNVSVTLTENEDGTATLTVDQDVTKVTLGEVTLTVASTEYPDVKAEITVTVLHALGKDVSIDGTAKFGQTLTANTNEFSGHLTDPALAALTYKWYRLETTNDELSDDEENGNAIDGAVGKTYQLKQDDIGKYIAVKVIADEKTFYVGEKTYVFPTEIAKADGPAQPSLLGGKVSASNANDGTITIQNYDNKYTYQLKKSDDSNWPDAENAPAVTELSTGVYGFGSLEAGEYQVRIAETDTHEASRVATVDVADADEVLYPVKLAELEYGTIERSRLTAKKDTPITITVVPDAGYVLDESSLKVTYTGKDADEPTELTVGTDEDSPLKKVEGQENQYTFTMPDLGEENNEGVTISATFSITMVHIVDELQNLTCDLTNHDVEYGSIQRIVLTPERGYALPERVEIYHATKNEDGEYEKGEKCPSTEYLSNGTIVFNAGGLTEDIIIIAEGEPLTYRVRTNLTNLTSSNTATTADWGTDYTTTLTPVTGYALPTTIRVTMDGVELELKAAAAGPGEDDKDDETQTQAGEDEEEDKETEEAKSWYTYDSKTGVVTVHNVTGLVVITAAGLRELTSVTIEIHHGDSTVASTDGDTPHTGDWLEAHVMPAEANVNYQWYRVKTTTGGEIETTAEDGEEITGATSSFYRLTDDDLGCKIYVVATGKGVSYSGAVTSEKTAPVADPTVKATGITLDKTTASMAYKQTLTLTATVSPSTATDKTVTWSSNNAAVATVDQNGVVTAVAPGTATITAENSAGNTRSCTVTVTKASIDGVVTAAITGTAQEGETLTATVTIADGNNDLTEANLSYKWVVVTGADSDGHDIEREFGQNTGNTYVIPADAIGSTVKVKVTADTDKWTGTVESSTNTVTRYVATHTIRATLGTGITNSAQNNNAIPTSVLDGNPLRVVLAVNNDYAIDSVEVRMGESVVTNAYNTSTRLLYIPSVIGNVEITVTTKSLAKLNALSLTAGTDPVALTPTFAADTAAYNATVASTVESVTVTATSTDAGATVKVYKDTDDEPATANSPANVALDNGTNTVIVTVSKAGMASKTYIVTIDRGANKSALTAAIAAAKSAREDYTIADNAADVPEGTEFVTNAALSALNAAITTAEAEAEEDLTAEEVLAAAAAMSAAINTFRNSRQTGTKVTTLGGSVTITGTAKFDETLTVNTDGVTPAAAKDSLKYQWKRDGVDITGATGATYKLVEADINKAISVVVTATGYTGSLTGTIGTVAKKDGPAAPSASATQCTNSESTDGKITIANFSANTYEYRKEGETSWTTAGSAEITNLPAGTYEVRVKVSNMDIQEEGAVKQVVVYPSGVTLYKIEVAVTHGSYTSPDEVAANTAAVVSLTASDGYVLPDEITVTMGGTALVADTGYTYDKGTGAVRIESVTGKVVITAEAIPVLAGTVTIDGTAKFGEELTATVDGAPSGATPAYQWKRVTTDGDGNETSAAISGATSATYELVEADIGKKITVVVTAAGYAGELTATTADAVAKADGPDAPDLSQTTCTAEDDTNGKITINGYVSTETYEIRSKTDGTWGSWENATVSADGVITVSAGTYQVRVKESATHKEGDAKEITVFAHDVTTFTVSITVTNGSYTGNATTTVESGRGYSTTVTASTGYVLPEDITVTDGIEYTYTDGTIAIASVTGNVTITVTCVLDTTPISGTVTIDGTLKFDEVLTAKVTGAPTGAELHYQWKRTKNGTTDVIGTDSSTYTLVGTDIGATITVVVTADGYDDELTYTTTDAVAKADGLEANWTLKGVAPTSEGGTGKITGLGAEQTYEVSTRANAPDEEWAQKTTNSDGEITGLTPGATYFVRQVQDANHLPNAYRSAYVPRYGEITYPIDCSGVTGGVVGSNASNGAPEGKIVRLTVTPNTGCKYVDGSLKVKYLDENGAEQEAVLTKVNEGEDYMDENGVTTPAPVTFYWFVMPAARVTVTAEFRQITHNVIVTVTNGTGSTTATVNNGGSYTVTVGADSNYKLPDTITVTMGGTDLVAGTGYTYNKTTGAITITNVTGDVTITVACVAVSTPPQSGPIGGGIVTPPTTTTVVENPDGSTTTTVTDNRTGTVTETTENPDGSTETVETKKDGTVTETTKNTDGSTEVVETKPDGTVTATNTDPEGGKVEKITTPDEDVTITVTDPEGEVLAKVEIPAEIPESPIQFVDVPGHWAESAINAAAGLGLVNGVGNGQFEPDGNMERGMLATILYRMSSEIKVDYDMSFNDVSAGEWYAEGVAWAAATGVVNGYNDTEFGPKDKITREQLAVMLYRYAQLLKLDTTISGDGLDAFTDAGSVDNWAEEAMTWCVEHEIIRGMGNDTLNPGGDATRAQVSVMLERFMGLMKK